MIKKPRTENSENHARNELRLRYRFGNQIEQEFEVYTKLLAFLDPLKLNQYQHPHFQFKVLKIVPPTCKRTTKSN